MKHKARRGLALPGLACQCWAGLRHSRACGADAAPRRLSFLKAWVGSSHLFLFPLFPAFNLVLEESLFSFHCRRSQTNQNGIFVVAKAPNRLHP